MRITPSRVSNGLLVLLALLCAAVPSRAADDIVPLKHGVYQTGDSICAADPANAGILTYDGKAFGGAHVHDCHATLVSKNGATYIVKNDCISAGEGNAHRYTETLVLEREKSTVFKVISKSDADLSGGPLEYRWCSADVPKS